MTQDPNIVPPGLLSVDEVCDILDIKRSKLYWLMRERMISYRRLGKGGAPKFTQADVDEYIASTLVPAVKR